MSHNWVELRLDVLTSNIRALRFALPPAIDIIFVVKSNAYGHGMIPVAFHSWQCGIRRYAVVHIDEAAALRRALPDAEILLLGALPPSEARTAIDLHVTPVIVSEEHGHTLARHAATTGSRLACHVKVNTGMGRLGLNWETATPSILGLSRLPSLDIQGICTHFASSGGLDKTFAQTQAVRFHRIVEDCGNAGLRIPLRHASNSGGTLSSPSWDFDAVRPGILLFGYGTNPALDGRTVATRPFLHWKTRVLQVKRVPAGFPVSYDSTYTAPRDTWIATIDIGYADGYSRLLGNRGSVLIAGKRRPVAGRVTMNLVTVDAGPDGDVAAGDEVVLLGEQKGAAIWADELAGWRDTISYEVLTNIRTPDCRVIAE